MTATQKVDVECQHCGKKFARNLNAGDSVKCPKCKTVLYLFKKSDFDTPVPSREAVNNLRVVLRNHRLTLPWPERTKADQMLRALLAEVESLNVIICADGETIEELCEQVGKLRAEVERVRAANIDCVNWTNAAKSEIDTLRTTVAQLERTVADQAAALAERDKVVLTDAMVERARIAETNFNVDIRGNGSCDRRAWHHSTEWTFEGKVFQSIDEAKVAQNRARLRMALDAALAASMSSASEEKSHG